MSRSPCVRCGALLHTGEGKVIVAFTAQELIDLAWDAHNGDRHNPVIARLLCAASLLDDALASSARADLATCNTAHDEVSR